MHALLLAALIAAIGPKGEVVRVETDDLAKGDTVGTVETAHGVVVTALGVTDAKTPFWIRVGDKTTKLARPAKRYDLPFSIAMTPTPDGFTVFFQEIEAQNTNEAHTYMVTLDKGGAVTGELREVAIPWWLADAVWDGKGYHLALFYSGEALGMRLSMVSADDKGQPREHPDWASPPGQLSDVHLVASGGKILAYYRALDRLVVSDVTTIGQWGANAKAGKDLGALAEGAVIAIDAKGQPVRVTAPKAAKRAR